MEVYRLEENIITTTRTEATSNMEQAETISSERWQGIKATIREIIETVLLGLLIFFTIRIFIQNFRIEGSSMEPNLHNGQYLIINKVAYRFRLGISVPLPIDNPARLEFSKELWEFDEPERGDVIVFHYPRNPQRDFIKRVIALPGETVEIQSGRVFIDGASLEETFGPYRGSYSSPPQTVPEDTVFVLGDNRDNSSDSHAWGMLPQELIVGKAVISYWPPQLWGLVEHGTVTKDSELNNLCICTWLRGRTIVPLRQEIIKHDVHMLFEIGRTWRPVS